MSVADGSSVVVDAHQHCWDPAVATYDWLGPTMSPIDSAMTFSELAPQLDAAGVDVTVMVQSADDAADTDHMVRVAATERRVAGIVVWVPLDRPAVAADRLDELSDRPGLVGVRTLIHNQPDPDWLLRSDVGRGLGLLERRGLAYDVVSVLPRHLEHVPVLSRRHPDLRIVIDHLSKPPFHQGREAFARWRSLIMEAARNPLVYAKVSGLYPVDGDPSDWSVEVVRPAFETALEAFGPDRLMYGGDWPISVLAGGYQRVWSAVAELVGPLSEDERAAVLGRTAVAFYRLAGHRLRRHLAIRPTSEVQW